MSALRNEGVDRFDDREFDRTMPALHARVSRVEALRAPQAADKTRLTARLVLLTLLVVAATFTYAPSWIRRAMHPEPWAVQEFVRGELAHPDFDTLASDGPIELPAGRPAPAAPHSVLRLRYEFVNVFGDRMVKDEVFFLNASNHVVAWNDAAAVCPHESLTEWARHVASVVHDARDRTAPAADAAGPAEASSSAVDADN